LRRGGARVRGCRACRRSPVRPPGPPLSPPLPVPAVGPYSKAAQRLPPPIRVALGEARPPRTFLPATAPARPEQDGNGTAHGPPRPPAAATAASGSGPLLSPDLRPDTLGARPHARQPLRRPWPGPRRGGRRPRRRGGARTAAGRRAPLNVDSAHFYSLMCALHT